MRVYQFRHIRADGQCSARPGTLFRLNRGLLVLAAAALATCVAAADGPSPHRSASVEVVVTLTGHDQDAFIKRLEQAIPGAEVRWRYRTVLNGLAVVVPEGSAKSLASLPGVAEVYPSVRYHRSLYQSPAVIGAPQVWGPTLATAGDGIKIGIIDDGLDRSHPFYYRVDWAGYRWTRVGENIAFGTGEPMPSARAIFAAWLRSAGHRANILSSAYRDIGVGSHPGTLDGASARFWVAEFGRP